MKLGNWVPLSKWLVEDLPKNRPYSPVEAAYSFQCDYDDNNTTTIQGYAKLWGWNRKTVATFILKMLGEIIYPEDTVKKRKQRGHNRIHKPGIKGARKGHKRFIDSNWLDDPGDIKGALKGHEKGIRRGTTTYPNPKPDPKHNGKKQFLTYVWLKEPEYERLCKDFGKDVVDSKIEDVDLYIGAKGKFNTYKDFNRVIRAWLKTAGVSPSNRSKARHTCRHCNRNMPETDLREGKCPVCGGER